MDAQTALVAVVMFQAVVIALLSGIVLLISMYRSRAVDALLERVSRIEKRLLDGGK